MSLVNRYNFARWDDGLPASSIESDLPNGYQIDDNRCDYKPLLIAGEAMRFYINALNGLDFIPSSGDTNKLALVNQVTGAVQNADIATLQTHTFIDGNGDTVRTYYSEVVISGGVPEGDYVFQIKQGATVLLTSNPFQVVSSTSDFYRGSVLAEFRHDRYFYGINYHQSLDGFYQQFRIHLNVTDIQQEGDKEVYFEVTTGKPRTYQNYTKELSTVESYYFDKMAHEAAGIMFEHDEIYLNLKKYTPKAVYKRDFDRRSKRYKGSIELYKEEFSAVNRCSSL